MLVSWLKGASRAEYQERSRRSRLLRRVDQSVNDDNARRSRRKDCTYSLVVVSLECLVLGLA